MNLHQLRIFHTVARLGSFSRAAEELGISQPSVSIQVADLERSLGVDLFEQLGKRIYLTEAGRILEDYARRILGLVEEASTAVSEVTGVHRGRLAVGASTTPGTYVLPQVIARYQERFPRITVTLDITNTRRIQERLLRDELDVGVVGWEINSHTLGAQPFFEDEIVLIAAPGHPLAAAEAVAVKVLRDHRLILRERGSGTREAVEAAVQQAGLLLPPAMELGSSEAIKEAVAAGFGVALLSKLAVSEEVAARRVVIVPLAGLRIRRALRIVVHRDKRITQAMRAFMEMLQGAVATQVSS